MSEILEYVKSQKDTRLKIREELVDLSKQTIATQAKKAEQLISNLVVYVEAIKMMGEDIFDLGVENEALRGKLGQVDEKRLTESKNRIKLTYNDARKNEKTNTKIKSNKRSYIIIFCLLLWFNSLSILLVYLSRIKYYSGLYFFN
jgi:hypothetical protein